MNTKRRKLKKVLDLREQALEKRALELAQSKQKLQEAVAAQSRESERLQVAEQHRERLTNGTVDIATWVESEQWLAHRKTELGRAHGRVTAAETTVQTAWTGVVEARMDKKRIELLDERLATHEVQRENRLEQRINDELSLRNKRSGGD